MNKQITRDCECIFRTGEESGEKYIEGYFAVFETNYDMGKNRNGKQVTESIARGAFDKYLGGDIRILANHDSTLVLGRTSAKTASVTSDERGIYVRCIVNSEDGDAMNLYARLKRGDVSQASFGGYIIDEARTENETEVHYTLSEINVFEFSVCTFPAYEETAVGVRNRDNDIGRWKNEMKEVYKKWH